MTKRYGDDDESHLLGDGKRVRLPLMMKDYWQRDVGEPFQPRLHLHDGRGNPVGHRPGYVVSDALSRDQRQKSYEA